MYKTIEPSLSKSTIVALLNMITLHFKPAQKN